MHMRLHSLTDQKETREGMGRGTQCMGLCMTSDEAANIRGRCSLHAGRHVMQKECPPSDLSYAHLRCPGPR